MYTVVNSTKTQYLVSGLQQIIQKLIIIYEKVLKNDSSALP